MTHPRDAVMDRCLRLAERGRNSVLPNPMVGAIIVRDGKEIAWGYHARYGGLHAEPVAIAQAGDAARGATLYCTLEPCSFTHASKHQPPCTDAIIEAGIAEVRLAALDPNPRVRGRGVQKLRRAGIRVGLQLCDEALSLNAVFNTNMALGRPLVILRVADDTQYRAVADAGILASPTTYAPEPVLPHTRAEEMLGELLSAERAATPPSQQHHDGSAGITASYPDGLSALGPLHGDGVLAVMVQDRQLVARLLAAGLYDGVEHSQLQLRNSWYDAIMSTLPEQEIGDASDCHAGSCACRRETA